MKGTYILLGLGALAVLWWTLRKKTVTPAVGDSSRIGSKEGQIAQFASGGSLADLTML
jgi:hypothetical protein